jgi:hypothetical protein
MNNLSYVLVEYADMMNEMCEASSKYSDFTKYKMTWEDLNTKDFPNYCCYKSLDDGILFDDELCESCENHWVNLKELLKQPSLMFLLNRIVKNM